VLGLEGDWTETNHDRSATLFTYPNGNQFDAESGHLWLLRTMSPSTVDLGIVAIDLGIRSRNAVSSIERNIDSFLVDASATLERLDVSRLISEANVRTQAEALRSALIGSVSHELRTPLSSILGAGRQSPSRMIQSSRILARWFVTKPNSLTMIFRIFSTPRV